MKKFNLLKEFSKHINYALENNNIDENFYKLNKEKIVLTEYQKFVSNVFLLENFKSLLLFWETGFGKTIQCVYIMRHIFDIYPQWKIFLFVKSSLKKDPWLKTINAFIPLALQQHIIFINYDLLNSERYFILQHSLVKNIERVFYIFDESHDFIKKLLPKENKVRRLNSIMGPLIKGINKPYNKTLFMSATPINDSYLEFNYMLHFLRSGNLEKSEIIFNKEKELIYPELLKKTCIGLTSFQRRSDIDIFKNIPESPNLGGKKIFFVDLIMSEEQSEMYKTVSQIELKSKSKGFRTLRKLVNTFAFLDIKIKSENINEEEKYLHVIKKKIEVFENYMKNVPKFSEEFLNKIKNEDLEIFEDGILAKNLNLKIDEEKSLITSNNFSKKKNEFYQEIKNLSKLHSYSSKYIKTCQLILQSRGKCLIFQPFVSFEGVKTFTSYLTKFNISYIEYTQETLKSRTELITKFNQKDNINGEKIKCCVLSSAGTEGISMTNITDLIIMDIPWSGSNLEQILGRAIRMNSHLELPEGERYVNVFILLNQTFKNNLSVDKEILNIILRKEKEKIELIKVLKETSLENIHKLYPFEEPVKDLNFYPLINNVYDTEKEQRFNISVLQNLIKIKFYYNDEIEVIEEGYLNEDNNKIYKDGKLIGYIDINENNKKIYKIINGELVYKIKEE